VAHKMAQYYDFGANKRVYMPQITQSQQLNAILNVITRCPEGLALEGIDQLLDIKLPKRTLQRRLAYLVETNQLQMIGTRKGARYVLIARRVEVPAAGYESSAAEIGELKRYLQQPLSQRKTVNYQREFLDRYEPNKTAYLSNVVRKHLWEIGTPFQLIRPAGTYAKKILNNLLIELSWNSSRLEGNTYSLLETERLLAAGKMAESRSYVETQMILNHKNAIEFLVNSADEIAFNSYTIFNLHAFLADNLLSNPKSCGRIRDIAVGIHGTAYRPLDVPQLLEECFQQILTKAEVIQDPFEQAFFVMVQLPYLQPFEDVNKRVSRLAANIPFIKQNLCPLSFVDVDNHVYVESILGVYELNRIELLRDLFVSAYEKSASRFSTMRHTIGEPDIFRLKYRLPIGEVVSTVVKKAMNKKIAITFIQQNASVIAQPDRARFVEVAETELLALHLGNIARYQLRPAEFEQWQKKWN
jgi:hypothetical protein